jgi:hypothetical protein
LFSTLNWRYLAFFVLLVGWVWFCYRMFAMRIHASIHPAKQAESILYTEGLDIPFAFNWGSAMPLAGDGFEVWKQQYSHIDSTGHIAIINGGYYRDEAATQGGLHSLGQSRINSFLREVPIDSHRIMQVIVPMEVNSDVRSKPFAAVMIDLVAETELYSLNGDTAQLCFPVADILTVPPYSLDQFMRWVAQYADPATDHAHITGTADGTGIAESSDVALERAAIIQEALLQRGWKSEMIHLSNEQRNTSQAMHNRCVLVYFEQGGK